MTPARSWRRLPTLTGALALLVLLVLTTDSALRTIAESGVAAQLAQPQTDSPQVEIAGRPFLLEAARGRFKEVRVTQTDVAVDGGLTLDRVTVTAQDVVVSVPSLLSGGSQQVTTGQVDATAVLGYPAVNRLLAAGTGQDLHDLHCGDAGDGRLRCTETVDGVGRSHGVQALVAVTLSGDTVVLTPAPGARGGAPDAARRTAGRLATTVDLTPLLFGLRPTAVTVGPDGLSLAARTPEADLLLG